MSIVITTPSLDTRQRIHDMFLSSPVSIDVNAMYVPLSLDIPVYQLRARGPYAGKFIEFRSKYSQHDEMMELVGVIDCPDMMETARSYGVPEDFELRLIFRRPAPPMSYTNRHFLVSIADTLCMKETVPFTFTEDSLMNETFPD